MSTTPITPIAPALTGEQKFELAMHHIQNVLQGGMWCASAFIGGVVKGETAVPHDPSNPAQVVACQLGIQLGPELKAAGATVLKAVFSAVVAVIVGEVQGLAGKKS